MSLLSVQPASEWILWQRPISLPKQSTPPKSFYSNTEWLLPSYEIILVSPKYICFWMSTHKIRAQNLTQYSGKIIVLIVDTKLLITQPKSHRGLILNILSNETSQVLFMLPTVKHITSTYSNTYFWNNTWNFTLFGIQYILVV